MEGIKATSDCSRIASKRTEAIVTKDESSVTVSKQFLMFQSTERFQTSPELFQNI
jgi:hypothetical protein